jgi:broad specificity phosphatase PhoE
MHIYLVRHGKTGGNAAHRHQSDSTGLTTEGVAQAKAVAKVLQTYEPTHLISSPLVRTLETAREIGAEIDLIAETNPVFVEIVRPRHLKGHHFSSFNSMIFYFRWYFGFTNTEKDGGETYQSLRNRVKAAQDFLATYPPDAKVVVVTHSVFINFFLFHLCNPKPVSMFRVPLVFLGILRIPNATVIPIVFDTNARPGTCAWRRVSPVK